MRELNADSAYSSLKWCFFDFERIKGAVQIISLALKCSPFCSNVHIFFSCMHFSLLKKNQKNWIKYNCLIQFKKVNLFKKGTIQWLIHSGRYLGTAWVERKSSDTTEEHLRSTHQTRRKRSILVTHDYGL